MPVPQYEVTFPYFDKVALIESNGTTSYDATRMAVMYERRRLVGFISRKQSQRRRFRFRQAWRGIVQYAYDVKPFMR